MNMNDFETNLRVKFRTCFLGGRVGRVGSGRRFCFFVFILNNAPALSAGKYSLRALPTFGGLVLGCSEADLCKQLFVLQHFSRSSVTFAHFCTVSDSEIPQQFVNLFQTLASLRFYPVQFDVFRTCVRISRHLENDYISIRGVCIFSNFREEVF